MVEWIRLFLITLILIRAVYTDVTKGRIENEWMFAGCICGLGLAAWDTGMQGVLAGMKMVLLLLTGLMILFVIKGLGGGDIKLFCVLAFFYPAQVCGIFVYAFFLAAGYSVLRMIWRKLHKKQGYIWRETIHFSIPIAIGTGITLWAG